MHALLVFVGEAGGSQSWSGLGCGVVVFGLLLLVIVLCFFSLSTFSNVQTECLAINFSF